jgi:hypothetical protein
MHHNVLSILHLLVIDRHAKRRMKERKVTDKEIESVLENPDYSEKSIKQRYNAFKWLNGRYLRITYKEELDHTLVITAVIRKKPFRSQ